MSEPRAPEDSVVRQLTPEEINDLNRTYRARLGKALSFYPSVRLMVTQSRWLELPSTETVEWPRENPAWRHTISRTSMDLTVRSEMLGQEGINQDTLYLYLPEDNPGISFTKVYQSNVVERPNGTSDVMPSADAVVSRIETQLRPPKAK
jgi:hypothetical protein